MKHIQMAPVGFKPEDHGYLVIDLLEQMPCVMLVIISTSTFPSLLVLNDLFSKEELDAGMSGGVCWKKFELLADDREELKQIVSEKYHIDFKINSELDALSSYDEWINKSLRYIRRTQ